MKRLEANTNENEYYARISKKLRNTKYLALLLTVACAFLTLFAYRDRLTYGNFRYLFRDIDAAGNAAFSSDTVYYTADENNTYAYFREDLAVGSSGGVAFHRAMGSRSFSDEVNFRSPVLAPSKKYLVAYDSGGYNFYVYNSLGRVYNEKLDSEIISAAAADNGHFALLLKNKKGGADIFVYDRNFNRVASLTRHGDAYTIGFLEDGRLYICECKVENASLYTDIVFYTVGEKETHGDMRVSGLAYKLGGSKNGFYALLDRGISFYGEDGEKNYSFGTADLLFADAKKDSVCVILKENSSGEECGAYLYNDEESVFYAVSKGAKGVALASGRICVLYDGRITVCYDGETAEIEIPTGARKIIAVDSDKVIVCYNDYAKIFKVR